MYENFTDRARKVMHLARRAAQSYNHDYIGTQHLLLGLIKEGSGVAACVLKELGVDLARIEPHVTAPVEYGYKYGTDYLLNPPPSRGLVSVIINAHQAAVELGDTHIGTEHLLLGLLSSSTAQRILPKLGLTEEKVREKVLNLLGVNTQNVTISFRVNVQPGDRVPSFEECVRKHLPNFLQEKAADEVPALHELARKMREEDWSIDKKIIEKLALAGRLQRVVDRLGPWASAAQDAAGCCQELKDIFNEVLELADPEEGFKQFEIPSNTVADLHDKIDDAMGEYIAGGGLCTEEKCVGCNGSCPASKSTMTALDVLRKLNALMPSTTTLGIACAQMEQLFKKKEAR